MLAVPSRAHIQASFDGTVPRVNPDGGGRRRYGPVGIDEDAAYSEQLLVTRCQAREPAAFRELFDRHGERVFRSCCLLLGDAADAEDALQTVFIHAFRKIETFEGRSLLSTWLHGIAIRVAANMRGSRKRRWRIFAAPSLHSTTSPTRSPGPLRSAAARESLGRVMVAVESLREKYRVPFVLYFGAGHPLEQVAQMIGAPPQTTWDRIATARNKILKRLQFDPLDFVEDGHE